MTFWELLRAIARYWVVVVIGVLCTAAAAFAVMGDKGVFFTRTEIVFLAPTSPAYPNALRTQSDDIIGVAGVVAKRMTGPGQVTKFASPDVTLVGMGVRDGWSLRLPDTGGQWATNFATQRLVLDIVAPSRDAVLDRQDELVQQIDAELSGLQRDAGVDPVNDITAIVAPETTVVYQVGGSRPRALGMTAVLGGGVTVAVIVVLHTLRRRRYSPPPAASVRPRADLVSSR